ncbi:hypothetical protein D3C76_1002620 [compost metagenome]
MVTPAKTVVQTNASSKIAIKGIPHWINQLLHISNQLRSASQRNRIKPAYITI